LSEIRIDRLRERLSAEGVDALLVTHPSNVRYMSGFTAGADASLLISATQALLATDFRYYEQVKRQAPAYRLFQAPNGLAAAFGDLAREAGARRIAFESTHITYALYQDLAKVEGVELVPEKGWVEELRAVKSAEELALIRQAVAISDAVIAALPHILRPGMTEKELAWEVEAFMHARGAEDVAFPIIAASGPNGAMPHAVPSERRIVPGEPLTLDLGARVQGYCSDLTRTVCIGQPDDKFREVYGIVLKAQQAAEAGIKAGMLGKDADALARQVIVDAGYGEAFGHGLGHGVGLDVHEFPRAGARSEDRLAPGMVVTVEPGIYLPGWGGVRIEDLVVVTESGIEILSQATKDPVVVL